MRQIIRNFFGFILIFVLIWIITWLGPRYILNNYGTPHCIKSHKEQQIKIPLGYNIGNGISMPLGNGTIEEIEVCDKYEWIK